MDQQAHLQQYQVWQYDPYHYATMVLLERYVMTLTRADHHGDVMAESRGGKKDMRLKKSFEALVERGTDWVSADNISDRLTSRQLKVKSKANNIAGLQLADLIAYPSFRATQARHNNEPLGNNFGGQIASILETDKYLRSPQGRIEGWGRKWLP